jgi:hypothetical protein
MLLPRSRFSVNLFDIALVFRYFYYVDRRTHPMKTKLSIVPAILFLLCLSLTAGTASAATRVVVSNNALCPPVTVSTTCHLNVQDAIDAAAISGDSIEIRPGTYSGNFTVVNKGISSISGIETAKTFLSGGGAGTILTIDSVPLSMSIRRLTFLNAGIGISVRNSPSITIKNNVFQVGAGSTAINITLSTNPTVVNNVFYRNIAGIVSDLTTFSIFNNIFYQNGNGVAINPSNMTQASISRNLFFNGTIGLTVITDPLDPNYNIINQDPLFVDPNNAVVTQSDYHLLASSPCITTGNTSFDFNNVGDTSKTDIGAYGGSSDAIPFVVSGLTYTASSTTPATISLTWALNKAYTTKGYNIYYGDAPGAYNGTDAIVSGGTTTVGPRIDAGNKTTAMLIVSRTSVTPAPTAVNVPGPLNNSLKLSWSAVTGATGYNIYYSLSSAPSITFPAIQVAGGGTTSYTLTGLTNGEWYDILIRAISQATYYFSITAYDTTSTTGTPGIAHESDYSAETPVTVGDIKISGPSNVVKGRPEPINPYPNLPNTGCFIATAAYGSPNDRSVTVLREFRDRYLVTNAPGRAFVRWYYANSPTAARFITDHPAMRPIARIVLAPAVAVALLLTHTSPAAQAAVLVMLIALASAVLRRQRTMRSRTLKKGTPG